MYNNQHPGGYPGQQQSGGYPGQQQPAGYPGQQQQSGGYPGQQQQPGGYPGQQQSGGYPGQQQQPGGYPGQQQSGGYPGQQQPGGYPGQQMGGYPGAGMPGMGAAPAPPPGVSQSVWQWFLAVDADRSGQINEHELRQALTNGDWKPFELETCILMIRMFDRDFSGTINAQEFQQLWDYIERWRKCFEGFDADRSGTINAQELNTAFQAFGYRFSPQFAQICVQKYDKDRRGTINFESFIQACVMLQNLTDSFKRKDVAQQGRAQLDYNSYLEMMLNVLMHRLGRNT